MGPPSKSLQCTIEPKNTRKTSPKSPNVNSRPSRAKKALDFGDDKKSDNITNPDTHLDKVDLEKCDNSPVYERFFSGLPSVPIAQPSSFNVANSILGRRKSQRLLDLQANELCSIPESFEFNDYDSGIEPTPPSSQTISSQSSNFRVPSIESKLSTSFDKQSVYSDYGTSSEQSFSIGISSSSSIKRRLRRSNVPNSRKRTRAISDKLSSGYASDFEAEDFAQNSRSSLERCLEEGQVDLNDSYNLKDLESVMDEVSRSSFTSDTSDSRKDKTKPITFNVNGVFANIPTKSYELPPDASLCYTTTQVAFRKHRLSPPSPFTMRTECKTAELQSSFLKYGLRLKVVSDIITFEPKETRFYKEPVIVSIPLKYVPGMGDEVFCLSTNSDDPFHDPFHSWSIYDRFDEDKYKLKDGRFLVELFEFQSLVVVIRERGIESQRQIRGRRGGTLYIRELPWIDINFPKGSLHEETITAKATVFLDTELSLPEYFNIKSMEENPVVVPLAAPVLRLEPHGLNFLPDLVTIEVPIPNYDEIIAMYPNARLQIWQSCTTEGETPNWEPLDVNYTLRKSILRKRSQVVMSFKVAHFSFFRVIWDLISDSLYEARVGMSYFHSFVTFSMNCRANMEQADTDRFALEVICCRSDKPFPERTNYSYKVGGSSKPKLVRPGRITVRLKSSYFEADCDAGEDASLLKEEYDFRGRDFEMQYCCKFKNDKERIDRGPFGKVIVSRKKNGTPDELLFEFNLQKSGNEAEKAPVGVGDDIWGLVALQELASSLFILEGDNWKQFAQHIGFTKEEIRKQFKPAPNPFAAIVSAYQLRQGTPNEFTSALFAVNRQIRINSGLSPCPSRQSTASNNSSGRGSMKKNENFGIFGSDSDTSGTRISQDSLLTGTVKKRSHQTGSRTNSSGSKPKPKKRRRRCSTPLDSSDGNDCNKSDTSAEDNVEVYSHVKSYTSSIERRADKSKLTSSFFWEISSYMDCSQNWKALGRTLRLEETIIVNLETTHRSSGIRELYYQTLNAWYSKSPKNCTFGILYQALEKIGMKAAAKKMIEIRPMN